MAQAILVPGILILISILCFIWWLFLLIDCIKRNFANPTEKLLWIIVLLVGNFLGALIYYFLVKKK
jgi:hypothetical protein